jgi:hypothetical protein
MISDRVPAGKHKKLTGIYRKKSEKFQVGILPPLPAISSVFLQDLGTGIIFLGR